MADKTGCAEELRALQLIEELTPRIFAEEKNNTKKMCANVDLYSGLIYRMLRIPEDLYTPLFVVARAAGWSAHRIEELETANRVIRPAYKNVATHLEYVPLAERKANLDGTSVYVPIEER